MFKYIALALSLVGSAAYADNTNTNTSQSQSHSTILNQGDSVKAASVMAPSVNTTAPCMSGGSFGAGFGGVGIGFGSSSQNKWCVTAQQANILRDLAAMPPNDPGRYAAIVHFCAHDKDMRNTMIALGWCEYK